MSSMRLVVSINSCWNFVNFRTGLIKAMIASGFEVVAVAPADAYSARLEEMGCRVITVPLGRRRTSPVRDVVLFVHYLRILKREKPRAFIGYTIKPNVYGSIAANLLGIPVINNIAGLGTTFLSGGWLNSVVRRLYRTALRRSEVVFFQNPDDRDLFIESRLVDAEVTRLLPGSGIDISRFSPTPRTHEHTPRAFAFLLAARMLWAKGVGDFVQAAEQVRRRHPNVRFQILGIVEESSRDAIPEAQLKDWAASGSIEFLGRADDVRPMLAHADCVVLPTYYPEGTPRILLEAAAMGKPLIATDVPGCRQIVDHGRNGFLCLPRNPDALAQSMLSILDLSPTSLEAMGAASREKAEHEFDEKIVVERYMEAIASLS